jgi:3,4-dihydroxy-9,10-secoandrosta-1,3,5(10)-triene-9,17-dione 4,5-dioxygenase
MGAVALGYVVIEATDLAKWDDYLTNIVGAMQSDASTDSARLYRLDSRPFRFWIEASERDVLAVAGWEVADQRAFDTLLGRLEAAGCEVELCDPARRGVLALARSSDPAGHMFEFFHGARSSLLEFVSPAGVSGFITGKQGELGMGHIVYGALNYDQCHHFYRDVMGFRDTDLPQIEAGPPGSPLMRIAFMHGSAGRHHSVAVIGMPGPPSGCIHLMVEAATMEDVGRAYDRMREANIPVSATLGKHMNDEVTSFYMLTPAGFDLEFGWGGLIVDPATWTPTAHNKISDWGHVWAWQEAMKAEMAKAEQV